MASCLPYGQWIDCARVFYADEWLASARVLCSIMDFYSVKLIDAAARSLRKIFNTCAIPRFSLKRNLPIICLKKPLQVSSHL